MKWFLELNFFKFFTFQAGFDVKIFRTLDNDQSQQTEDLVRVQRKFYHLVKKTYLTGSGADTGGEPGAGRWRVEI